MRGARRSAFVTAAMTATAAGACHDAGTSTRAGGVGDLPRTASAAHASAEADTAQWAEVTRGAFVSVAVERALFEVAGQSRFFVHVRVENLRDVSIGVDLRDPRDVFYPNQWGASSIARRGAVDERRFLPTGPLDDAGKDAILASHRAGALTRVGPRGAVDYYVEFNASSRADVEAQAKGAPFVIVVVDGRLRVTDGVSAERVDAPLDDAPREIALATPVRWRSAPSGARVLRAP